MLLDKILNTIFSFGAAVVIFGAWGKLEHAVFGDKALTIGLLTETAIFCLYGVLEWVRRPEPAASVAEKQGESQGARSDGDGSIGPRAGLPVYSSGSPVHKEDLEALTGSIKETANLLSRIFRV